MHEDCLVPLSPGEILACQEYSDSVMPLMLLTSIFNTSYNLKLPKSVSFSSKVLSFALTKYEVISVSCGATWTFNA
jgi:hypothetical protein